MTAATETVIDLDRKHRAIRSQSRWAVQRFQPDGNWDTIAAWAGGRRSLEHFCEQNDIHPSRDAEQLLGALPETPGFRERQ